ncbi:MAG: hypothetical protein L0241_21955 [Planctomycetia bacterium]|nr:hypothetical protein [Planctomycetia bacterium]
MRPVSEYDRVAELRRLGVSNPVIRLATGALKLDVFSLIRKPYKVYRGIEWSGKVVFVPLWERDDVTTAVREKGDGLEFFAVSVEAPSSPWRLAGTEQGLLATLFHEPLNNCYDEPDEYDKDYRSELKAAAKSLGFRHLAELDAVFSANYSKPGEALERAYKRFIRALDAADA